MPVAESIALVVLLASLAMAVIRPRGLSEATVAVPGAALLVVTGVVPPAEAWATITHFGPTVIFLAGILLFGQLAADAGVFRYLGGRAAWLSRGRPVTLLTSVVALAAAVTAVLTLDATIVLLTPVVLTAAVGLNLPPRPHLYACARLANSASLLLPISNLTNLIAFSHAEVSFGRFTALMTLPWIFVCVAEWCALRMFFRRDLASPVSGATRYDASPAPRTALIITVLTVAGFLVTSAYDLSPAWAAFAGAAALVGLQAYRERHGGTAGRGGARDVGAGGSSAGEGDGTHMRTPGGARDGGPAGTARPGRADLHPGPPPALGRLVRAAHPGFCAFVLALAVIVDAVMSHGLGDALGRLIPSGTGLADLLAVTFLAAALANIVNNLPATLVLVPLLAGRPELMPAMLIGVNIGPNLSYAGSLATLLWRRLLPAEHRPRAVPFHALSATTVPLLLAGATTLLWVALQF